MHVWRGALTCCDAGAMEGQLTASERGGDAGGGEDTSGDRSCGRLNSPRLHVCCKMPTGTPSLRGFPFPVSSNHFISSTTLAGEKLRAGS
jgi:hypothetical protein